MPNFLLDKGFLFLADREKFMQGDHVLKLLGSLH